MKNYSEYICQQCGYISPSFLGKCPECGEWNSLVESVDTSRNDQTPNSKFPFGSAQGLRQISDSQLEEKLYKLSDIKSLKVDRITTGFGEFDRVLGGGIVPGSIVLLAGDPGIGKSTLLLQTAVRIAGSVEKLDGRMVGKEKRKQVLLTHSSIIPSQSVLYVSGEESAQQIKIRADRIGKIPDNLFILPETDTAVILAASEKLHPKLLIVDSIQTLTSIKLTGAAGSVGQLRECSTLLQRYAKSSHVPIFVVGHVTKEGSIAGPKVLEHLVDTVLNVEGDDMYSFRLVRSSKNRFGSTFEVGVFEMHDTGLVEVPNPSKIFLEQRIGKRAGSVVCATVAGGRPLLCEVQALTTSTMFGIPARRFTGLDFSRMQIVIASLSKAAKLNLGTLDIYLNVAGGLKAMEPACDLAAAVAIASAVSGRPVKDKLCAFGEVGLLGELRPVSNSNNRISEAKRMGFSVFVTPDKFRTVEEAVRVALV